MKIKLANGNKYSISKASEIFDIIASRKNLEISVTGDNAETVFQSLITDLHTESNLKNIVIEREITDLTFAEVELEYSSLNIFDNYTEGFIALRIIENNE